MIRRNNPRIALFVSRVHPKKGLFNLVDAWELLKKRPASISGWRFVIAGPDEEGFAAAVMARANAAGVGGDFEMVGPTFGRQKEDLYAHADLFVLPTFSENFGVVVIEALAHGCPVITTKGAPWAELVGNTASVAEWQDSRDVARAESTPIVSPATQATPATPANPVIAANGRCGWWIDIGVEPLADALREAMALTDEERWAMGQNGRILVETKYTWPAITVQMKSAYEKVLEFESRFRH
jgi:glycosyltransferase involved in cell wall biosynthesis